MPITAASLYAAITTVTGGVNAVGQTRPRDVLRTKAILERAGTPILGVVLNRTPVKQLNSYYKQYSAYYGA